MAIDQSYYALFKNGSVYQQTQFLDDFYTLIDIDTETGTDLVDLLTTAISQTVNSYVKRSLFKLMAELTLLGKISNVYALLNIGEEFLNGSDVLLQTIVLKYLCHFESNLSAATIDRIIELSDSPDGDVASQAYYLLGIRKLTSSLAKADHTKLVIDLNEGLRYFNASAESSENRTDAEFFIIFIEWIMLILAERFIEAKESFAKIEENLRLSILYFDDGTDWVVEYLIFEQVNTLSKIMTISASAKAWLDIKGNVELLMQLKTQRTDQLCESRINAGLLNSINKKMLEGIEETTFALHLAYEKDRLAALKQISSENDLNAFISYIIRLFPDTDASPSENYELLAILSEFAGSEQGVKLYQQVQQKELTVEKAIRSLLYKANSSQLPFKTGSVNGEEVLLSLMKDIDNVLPNYPANKRQVFMNVLEEVIRYARTTFVNNDKSRYKFLFSTNEGGKGQTAIEQDLQDSMLLYFEHSKIADGLEHEKAKFVDGGRVDILYKKDIITIPMELKKSLNTQDKASMEENYIAQAQTYTAGYDQLGIFILLELSDKSSAPPPNFKDWFNMHHLMPSSELDLKHPDHVISVVIPGNRTLPSTKSTYQ